MTTSKSYFPRKFPGHPGDCMRLGTPEETCWGRVTYSTTHQGLCCEGHHAKVYRPEIVFDFSNVVETQDGKPLEEDPEDAKQAMADADRDLRFQTMAERGKGPHPCWSKLSDVLLRAVASMLGDGARDSMNKDTVNRDLQQMRSDVLWQIEQRQIPWPEGYYDLHLAPDWHGVINSRDPAYTDPIPEKDLQMDMGALTDRDLLLLYGAAGMVADFSCLERGARQVCMSLFYDTKAALESRGIVLEWLFDLDE